MTTASKSILTPLNVAWILGYVAAMCLVWFGLNRYRQNALIHYGTKQAESDWQEWRDAVDQMKVDSPVERDQPKSLEPPSLVLMRDHFGACLGISLLLSSCLFVWFMVCIRGALRPVSLYDDHLEPFNGSEANGTNSSGS